MLTWDVLMGWFSPVLLCGADERYDYNERRDYNGNQLQRYGGHHEADELSSTSSALPPSGTTTTPTHKHSPRAQHRRRESSPENAVASPDEQYLHVRRRPDDDRMQHGWEHRK